MRGPEILARSLSHALIPDKYNNHWQYHSRSDRHSKICCWALLFDLINHCSVLRDHISDGKVGFGINHTMLDFKSNRKKDLDLVLCTVGPGTVSAATFTDLVEKYGIELATDDRTRLDELPSLNRVTVGSVHVALEAKACMTAHIKALPRLYDELNSSHLAIHGASAYAIAAGFAIVNIADRFLSPGKNTFDLSKMAPNVSIHNQPLDTIRTLQKLEEIPRRSRPGEEGFDAFGTVVLDCVNDGSAISVITAQPAPQPADIFHYDRMVMHISHLYHNRFSGL